MIKGGHIKKQKLVKEVGNNLSVNKCIKINRDIKMSRQKFSIFKELSPFTNKIYKQGTTGKKEKHENITRKIIVKPFGSYAVK